MIDYATEQNYIKNDNLLNFETKIINDKDNAHDRTVNELSKIYYIYLKNNTPLDHDIDDLLNCVNDMEITDENDQLKKNLILNYLNNLFINNVHIVNFECNEYDFLILCWNRTLIEKNKNNKKKIQSNIFDCIVDFYATDFDIINLIVIKKMCCPSGRINKLLSSFCNLDVWHELGEFMSTEMLKKEFNNKASTKFNDTITYSKYSVILDDIVSEYHVKYHKSLIRIKDELLNSLVF
tara:strand:+ start:188 stop:898 length:711 start_codon:yes stop_codon:yes gene_type:complete